MVEVFFIKELHVFVEFHAFFTDVTLVMERNKWI